MSRAGALPSTWATSCLRPPPGRAQSTAVSTSVAELDEAPVETMGITDAGVVLDGAPIDFGACRDLTHVRDDAVGVCAVRAVQLSDDVQVRQTVPVDGEVPAARHAPQAIDRKARPLLRRHDEVKQHQWDGLQVDQRCRDRRQQAPTLRPHEHPPRD